MNNIPEPNPSGLCMCGCEALTPLARQNETRRGWVKGKPLRFLPGHGQSKRKAEDLANPNPTGLCMCGCSLPAPIAKRTTTGRSVKGFPQKYLKGHQPRVGRYLKGPDYIEEDRGHKTPCWIWQRGRYTTGYGFASYGQTGTKKLLAHRFYFEKFRGPIPEGMSLDHLCRVPPCVNPQHLEPVTHAENCRRGEQSILTATQVTEIRCLIEDGVNYRDIAQRFGVAPATINGVLYGNTWK